MVDNLFIQQKADSTKYVANANLKGFFFFAPFLLYFMMYYNWVNRKQIV